MSRPSCQFPHFCIAQFAKAPKLGGVKTRMCPVLSDQQCLALHKQLTQYCFNAIQDSSLCPHQLWVSARVEDDFFQELCGSAGVTLTLQQGADLGERMAYAQRALLLDYQGVIIVGSDCPALDTGYLLQACNALQNNSTDVVLGPATDGGYVLIGSKHFFPELFSAISWGSGQVLAQTLEKCQALALKVKMLAPLSDVDRPDDLALIRDIWQP